MYNQQSYHTSSYAGNTQGHDAYLHSDSARPSSYGVQSQVASQYRRGSQKTFQPTGMVQSVYGQNQSGLRSSQFSSPYQNQFQSQAPYQSQASYQSQAPYQSQAQYQSQAVNPQSFHTSNYKGQQQGHDSYIHSDSQHPAQSQFRGSSSLGMGGIGTGSGYSSFSSGIGTQFGTSASAGHSLLGTAGQSFSGIQSSASQPSLSGSMMGMSQAGFSGGTSIQNQFSNQSRFQNQYQQQQTPQSFHTANYAGNQPNHDQHWRADSQSASQSQFAQR